MFKDTHKLHLLIIRGWLFSKHRIEQAAVFLFSWQSVPQRLCDYHRVNSMSPAVKCVRGCVCVCVGV